MLYAIILICGFSKGENKMKYSFLINSYFCFLIVVIPIFIQLSAYQSIDENKFKKYKIKKFGFLFKGMQGKSASTHGVILPMLIIQIQGYIIGIITFIFAVINEILKFIYGIEVIVAIVWFIHTVIIVLIATITGIVSKKRKKIIR